MFIGLLIFVIGYVTFYWGETHFGHQCRYSYWDLLGLGSIAKGLSLSGVAPFTFGMGTESPAESWVTLPGCQVVGQAIPKQNGYGPATPDAPCGTFQGKPIPVLHVEG